MLECTYGAVCALSLMGRAEVAVNLSMTVESSVSISMVTEGSEIMIAGTITGVPEAKTVIARVVANSSDIMVAMGDSLEVVETFAYARADNDCDYF